VATCVLDKPIRVNCLNSGHMKWWVIAYGLLWASLSSSAREVHLHCRPMHFAFGSHPPGHILCTQSDSNMHQPIACIAGQCNAEYYAAWEVPM